MWQLCIYNIIWHLYNIVILHYAECNIILLHDKKWFCTILKQPIRFQQYLLKKTSLHCCVNIPQNQRIYKSDSYVTSFDQSALRKPNRHIIIYIFSTPYAQLTSTCKNDFVQGRYCHEAIRIRQHLTRPAPPPPHKKPPQKTRLHHCVNDIAQNQRLHIFDSYVINQLGTRKFWDNLVST